MSALRLLSTFARRVPPVSARRGYAEVSDKLKLSMVLPHQVRCAFDYRLITGSMLALHRQSSLPQMSFK